MADTNNDKEPNPHDIAEVGSSISEASAKAVELGNRLIEVAKDADSANHSLQTMAKQGMSEAEVASTKTANAAHQAEVQMGQGAQGVKTFFDDFKNGAIGATTAIPGLAQGIGGAIQAFGILGKTIGGTITFTARAMEAINQYNALQDRRNAKTKEAAAANDVVAASVTRETAAQAENTIATEAAGVAVAAEGEAAAAAAIALEAEARSADAAAASLAAEAVATDVATASTVALTIAQYASKLGFVAIGIAAGVALDAVIEKLRGTGNAIEDNLDLMEKLHLRWLAFKSFFHLTSDDELNSAAREDTYKYANAQLEQQYTRDMQSGMDPDKAKKKLTDAQEKLENNFAKNDVEWSDPNAYQHQQNADELKEQRKLQTEMQQMPPTPATLMGSTLQAGGDPGLSRGNIDSSRQSHTTSKMHATATGHSAYGRSVLNVDASATDYPAGGALTIHPKTSITRNGAGHYVLKILPTEVVIPNDFHKAVARL